MQDARSTNHTHREHMQHSVSTSVLTPDRDPFFLEYGTSPRGRGLPAALAEGHTGRPRRGGWSAVGGGSGQAQGGPAASRVAAGLAIGGSGLWEAEAVGGGRGTAGGRGTGSGPCAAGTGGRRAALPSSTAPQSSHAAEHAGRVELVANVRVQRAQEEGALARVVLLRCQACLRLC